MMETRGIKPLYRPCKGRVFPLHKVSNQADDETRTRIKRVETSHVSHYTISAYIDTPGWTRTSNNLELNEARLPIAPQRFIGMVGFEPTTPCSQNMASRPLNYIPLVPSVGLEPTKSGWSSTSTYSSSVTRANIWYS